MSFVLLRICLYDSWPCAKWSLPLGGRFFIIIDDVFVRVLSRFFTDASYISSFFSSSFRIFVRAASTDWPFLEIRRVIGLIMS